MKICCNELDSQMLSCGISANMLQIKYKMGLCTMESVTFGHVFINHTSLVQVHWKLLNGCGYYLIFLLLIQWMFDFLNNLNCDSIVVYYFESHLWCSCYLFHFDLFFLCFSLILKFLVTSITYVLVFVLHNMYSISSCSSLCLSCVVLFWIVIFLIFFQFCLVVLLNKGGFLLNFHFHYQ